MTDLINGFKVYSKYADGYTYLILEVDNPLIDGLISFATQVCFYLYRWSSQFLPYVLWN